MQKLSKVQKASRKLAGLPDGKVNEALVCLSSEILLSKDQILAENKKDLENMSAKDARYDRLKLTEERLEGISKDIRNIALLDSPLGKILERRTLKNGLELSKVSVPLGVIGIIYEARPNVTLDVFALCIKSGNACVLKGGADAKNSNKTIVSLIHEILDKNNIDKNIVCLLPPERTFADEMLKKGAPYIDVIIPRGSANLIAHVRENSKIPVIETGAGVVHAYFDEHGNLEKAKKIILNAKTRRPSVCNSLDTLIIHKSRLLDLAELIAPLLKHDVEIFADDASYSSLPDSKLIRKACPEDFGKEFLSLKMSIKTVSSIDEAIEHITKYSSKHTEAIISENKKSCEYFVHHTDSAVIFMNASTAFTDGAQFGLGAEIGISTQKLHTRGPMGLKELTSYKWVIRGDGQILED